MQGKQYLVGIVAIAALLGIGVVQFVDYDSLKSTDKAIVEDYVPPNLQGKRITVLTINPHRVATEALAKWFQDKSNAVVQTIIVDYSKMRDYIIQDAKLDNPRIDVVTFWYVDIGLLAENNALMDLTDFIVNNETTINPNDFISSLYDPYTKYKNRRWALPFDGDTHILFYRKSILKRYGFDPPDTWEQYTTIAKTITENENTNGLYGAAIMAPPIPMLITSSFMNRLGSFGGKLLDGRGKPVVNSKEAVLALTALRDHTQHALPTPFETDFEVSRDAFLSGKVAMAEQWTDIGIMAENLHQSSIKGDWGAVQMPMGSGAKAGHVPALNAGFSIGIAKNAQNPEVAKQFLLFAANPGTALKLSLLNGGVDPVRKSTLTSDRYKAFSPELSRATQSAINGSTAWPTIPESSQMLEVLTKNIIKCLYHALSPQKALDDTQQTWERLLGVRKSTNPISAPKPGDKG